MAPRVRAVDPGEATATGAEVGAVVTGAPVSPPVVAVQPSAAAVRSDAKGRVGNTATQAGVAGAVVIIGGWGAALGHLDLDPYSSGRDLPAPVAGAFGAILTLGVAWWMNRAGLRAADE